MGERKKLEMVLSLLLLSSSCLFLSRLPLLSSPSLLLSRLEFSDTQV